ncbi:MAG: ATP-binding cassette domain-containing protein, partial [Eubacteriales bacterium]|nr:ATP-binding cassette domain-containing protein [Eubacteriales bacterium]
MGVVLETRKLTKRFPGTIASNEIDFDVRSGEVHAIIGENGAGKSTICKMLTGLYQPDSGEIYFMGRKVVFRSTGDAMRAGINMVYQERNLISHLTGAQNIMLGSEPVRGRFFLDEKRLREIAKGIQGRLGMEIPLDVPVGTLSAGVQQSIEILRAFATEPRLLVLDEPTASLGEREIVPFLHFVEELRSRMEIAVIFISHKLDEVFQVADRISVFTEGVKVMTVNKPETTREACIAAMLKNGSPEPIVVRQTVENPATVLRAGTCVYDGRPHRLDIHVEEGEVVGFYGLVGAGRTECAQAIAGLRPDSYTQMTIPT